MAKAREPADLLVIGGGINGVGIARDAAGRGLDVVLCEQGDLAAATSSASTKLIHGGLRYLESWEFGLVRKALIEREVLLRMAPHIIWPLSFVLPHDRGLRPAWMIRLGLFLYDHLGGRERLPGSRGVDLSRDPRGAPLAGHYRKGFVYADCWADDSRLVVLNAVDARERGARILTRTRCAQARRSEGLWHARLETTGGGGSCDVRARALVNAGGPWVQSILHDVAGLNRPTGMRLVKGSHIVVPRLYDGEQAYILQNDDRRIVFVIPYEDAFTLVGTTDVAFDDDPGAAAIEEAEIDYLCRAVSRVFAQPLSKEAVVHSFSGVRPLYDDHAESASTITRDYVLDLDAPNDAAPMLSVFGGKLTTYRRLAEQALAKLGPLLDCNSGRWTGSAPLPGGDIPGADFDSFAGEAAGRYAWLDTGTRRRLLHAYGTRVERILGAARAPADLGEDLGGGLREAELDYLCREEWAFAAEDVLWRRSKLGLTAPAGTERRIADWLAGNCGDAIRELAQ